MKSLYSWLVVLAVLLFMLLVGFMVGYDNGRRQLIAGFVPAEMLNQQGQGVVIQGAWEATVQMNKVVDFRAIGTPKIVKKGGWQWTVPNPK